MLYARMHSPVGDLLLASSRGQLRLIKFSTATGSDEPPHDWVYDDAALREASNQLQDYFKGRRCGFDTPLAPCGTDFQRRVWEALLDIPYGETRSYKDIAVAIGSPKAAMAVGQANAKNPLPIMIPCHRVIGSKGQLTGYGGGLLIKQRLLDLERRHAGY